MGQTATDTGFMEALDLIYMIGFGAGVFILCVSLMVVTYKLFTWIEDTLRMAERQVRKNRRER